MGFGFGPIRPTTDAEKKIIGWMWFGDISTHLLFLGGIYLLASDKHPSILFKQLLLKSDLKKTHIWFCPIWCQYGLSMALFGNQIR